jgi:hypothetical protein
VFMLCLRGLCLCLFVRVLVLRVCAFLQHPSIVCLRVVVVVGGGGGGVCNKRQSFFVQSWYFYFCLYLCVLCCCMGDIHMLLSFACVL